MKTYFYLLLLLFLWGACQNSPHKHTGGSACSKKYTVEHSRIFLIAEEDGFDILQIRNPWKEGEFYAQFLLKKKEQEVPRKLAAKYRVLEVPVKRVASLSNTNIGMLKLLGEHERISGVTLPDRVYDPTTYQRYVDGEIKDLGNEMAPNVERIIAASPDLVMKSGFPQSEQQDQHLINSGLPVLYNVEWMETTSLGRAEWIKVHGLLTGCYPKADSIFNAIKNNYLQLKKLAETVEEPTMVMMGAGYKGTWYIPGGASYMARLAKEAGGFYPWHNDSTSGSLAMSYEAILENMLKAGVWIYSGEGMTLNNLCCNSGQKLFKSVKNNRVYGRFGRLNERGANDYWETGTARPDLLLSDMIKLLHPSLLPDYTLTYYKNID